MDAVGDIKLIIEQQLTPIMDTFGYNHVKKQTNTALREKKINYDMVSIEIDVRPIQFTQ